MGYSRLEPGRELEVREYISFQRGRDGFYELTECSVDELLKRKAASIVREKELCQRIDAAVEAWSKQAHPAVYEGAGICQNATYASYFKPMDGQ